MINGTIPHFHHNEPAVHYNLKIKEVFQKPHEKQLYTSTFFMSAIKTLPLFSYVN